MAQSLAEKPREYPFANIGGPWLPTKCENEYTFAHRHATSHRQLSTKETGGVLQKISEGEAGRRRIGNRLERIALADRDPATDYARASLRTSDVYARHACARAHAPVRIGIPAHSTL